MKAAVMAAFDKVGAEEYLAQQAIENPTAFIGMLSKILPKDVNVGGQEDGVAIKTALEVAFVNATNRNTNGV
jgi:hypothetical protein